jgi:Family of unknown function (DUF5995)
MGRSCIAAEGSGLDFRGRTAGEFSRVTCEIVGWSEYNWPMSTEAPGAPGQPSDNDELLYNLVIGPAPATIADVIARMQAMDALLPVGDGLKWFNQLYLAVTQQVDLHPPGGAWQSPAWLLGLDVIFAGFYFDALSAYLAGEAVACAWSAFFEARYRPGIDRIQFALAGVNAHINHDLALALLATDAVQSVVPGLGSPEHADYEAVNGLLNTLLPAELNALATDTLGVLAEDTGKIGRLLAFWDICKARDLAWDFADHLRGLTGVSRDVALSAQDAVTGARGRAILAAA